MTLHYCLVKLLCVWSCSLPENLEVFINISKTSSPSDFRRRFSHYFFPADDKLIFFIDDKQTSMWNAIWIRDYTPWNSESFVAGPLCWGLFNALLAVSLAQITKNSNEELLEQALQMISLLTSAAVPIMTLTFSLTVLSVQLATQLYSARLLDVFIKDPVSKMVISVNVGALSYCYTLFFYLYDNENIPFVAIYGITVQMVGVLGSFINFIHFFMVGFRLESIMERASNSALSAADRLGRLRYMDATVTQLPDVPPNAYVVTSDTSGYVKVFRFECILQQAEAMDVCVRYMYQIGEYVNRGTTLCYVWDAKSRKETNGTTLERRILSTLSNHPSSHHDTKDRMIEQTLGLFAIQGVCITKQREGDFDVTLGIQQLADIAMKALSPGINDPTTAIQCMDTLTGVLASIAREDLATPWAVDADGVVRLCAPQRSFAYLLSILDGIRLYGGNDLAVCRRGLRLFGDLAVILARSPHVERIPTALAQLEQWMVVARRNFPADGPELNSLSDLRDYLLRSVALCDSVKIRDGETLRDLQEFETTFQEETEERISNATIVSEFLQTAFFSSSGE